jgi:lipopolysaccharide export system permease protein
MLKIYQKYIINLYTKLLVKITGVFFILTFVLNIFEEINYFKDSDVGFLFPILLTLLNIPSLIFEILPFIFLITTQFFFFKIIGN